MTVAIEYPILAITLMISVATTDVNRQDYHTIKSPQVFDNNLLQSTIVLRQFTLRINVIVSANNFVDIYQVSSNSHCDYLVFFASDH